MIATTRNPYLDLSFHQSPPRVISEIRKATPAWPKDNVRPRISGELLCWMPTEGRWRARRVTVRCGQLQIGGGAASIGTDPSPRLALRRLSLTQGPNAHSFALRRGFDTPPVLTLQASNQREFDLWVRTIAIELIRQTPLDAIKYLDILTLAPQLHTTPTPEPTEKDCNHNSISNPVIETSRNTFRSKSLDFDTLDENKNYCSTPKPNEQIKSTKRQTVFQRCISDKSPQFTSLQYEPVKKPGHDDEQTVELLLKKCQNADSYVPVKEKLKLFESLCRLGRTDNSEDIMITCSKYTTKRTRSLHDLSNSSFPSGTNAGVKQICQYFETKNDENKEKEVCKFNTIARGNRTSCGPVKTMISRKYSVQSAKNY